MSNKPLVPEGFLFDVSVSDLRSPQVLERIARRLIGKTFREIHSQGFNPDGIDRAYNNAAYKGGLGTLVEEYVFGYRANSDSRPDFVEANVELKTTCFDVKRNGDLSAGERLVLSMIPYDCEVSVNLYASHLWPKMACILLVIYRRDEDVDKYDQQICYAKLFTPPAADLKIIEDDYRRIVGLLREGKAEQLSEGMTTYLGSCTKGQGNQQLVAQFYPPHTGAKRRAFCYKRSYMDYVLHHYIMPCSVQEEDSIVKDTRMLETWTFEELVLSLINENVGATDRELCAKFGMDYTGNKAQWTQLVYRMLGVRGQRAEEFEKANISVRTVREDEGGQTVRESLSLNTFKFADLLEQKAWDEAPLRDYMDETRFLFVVFEKIGDASVLKGSAFWSMPVDVIDGALRDCWEEARYVVQRGVKIVPKRRANGGVSYENDLPGITFNGVAHVRPHTARRYYRFLDGTEVGDDPNCGNELPDGRWMTTQSFWLNGTYIRGILRDAGL